MIHGTRRPEQPRTVRIYNTIVSSTPDFDPDQTWQDPDTEVADKIYLQKYHTFADRLIYEELEDWDQAPPRGAPRRPTSELCEGYTRRNPASKDY